MTIKREFAPAKVNLTLNVLGRRPDGYHELESLVAFADIGDRVTLDTSKPVGVTTSGPFARSIAGANLIETTLRYFAEEYPKLQLGAVHLEKNLPVAAGIGGGSADAAAVIRCLEKANLCTEPEVDWNLIALRIGADVPVCLVSHLSWVCGIGEVVAPLRMIERVRIPALVVNPLVAVPADKTARVFAALSAPALPAGFQPLRPEASHAVNSLMDAVMTGSNALEPAARAIVPAVAEVLAELRKLERCRLARMSGGGPTCFALFDSDDDVTAAAKALSQNHADWWIIKTTLA